MDQSALKRIRKAAGMTQAELGARVGMSNDTISRIETGRQIMSMDEAMKIASALNVSLTDLVGHSDVSITQEAEPIGDETFRALAGTLDDIGIVAGDMLATVSVAAGSLPEPYQPVVARYGSNGKAIYLLRQFVPPLQLATNSTRDHRAPVRAGDGVTIVAAIISSQSPARKFGSK